MIVDYSYRSYRDGDAEGINSLYERVTGYKRTREQFEWQWLAAPGGKAEIWLIEAVHEDGNKELIGHHGVMPVRFSFGSENLLFGKTENTLVLPEFRRKILYPRFEKRFLTHYESRFDALFSTMGPSAAIRQRQALGYECTSKFVTLKFRTGVTGEIAYVVSRLRRLVTRRNPKVDKLPFGFDADSWLVQESSCPDLRVLDDESAATDPFFDDFWRNIRGRFGLTPRRDAEDLRWRFWNNPYKDHLVLVSDAADSEPGYVVLSRSVMEPESANIEDIVPCDPRPESFARLLAAVLCRLRELSIPWVTFWTTDESCAAGKIVSASDRHVLRIFAVEQNIGSRTSRNMPRRSNKNGSVDNIVSGDWYVTPMLFEGRVAT